MDQSLENAARHETVMDVTHEQIARVYAQAFLGAANAAGDAVGLVEELGSLVSDVLDRFPGLEKTLGSALLSHDEKVGLLDRTLGGQASPTLLNFLKVLSAHQRLEIVRATARAAQHLLNKQLGKVEVELTVANPMDGALQSEVTTALRTSLAAEPVVSIYVDPSLIAGFVVKVGDTVYDGSIRTRFERARKAMIERAIADIESHPEKFFNGEPG
jgi:F-type H+-transporting ATPase subunit delta